MWYDTCPICGDPVDNPGRLGGWPICLRHWVRIQPSKYASRCCECLGQILPGEEVVLSKDTEDGRWVVLHRRDRCEGLAGSAPGAPHVVRPDGPWGALFLVPGAPPEVVKAVYRALAQLYHPDRGGDAARMAAVNAAVAELIK